MAARELIHFPFRVQLILRPRVPARIASPAGLGVSFLAESALLLLIAWFCARFVGCTIRSLNEIGAYTNGQNTELICRQERVEVGCYYGLHRSGKEIGSGLKKIYIEIRGRKWKRQEQGPPARVLVLPWSQADYDRILAARKVAFEVQAGYQSTSRTDEPSHRTNEKSGGKGAE